MRPWVSVSNVASSQDRELRPGQWRRKDEKVPVPTLAIGILYHTRISALVELPLAVPKPLLPMLVMLGTPAARASGPLRSTLTTIGISTRWWPVGVPVPAARWIVSVTSGWRRGVWVTVRFSAASAYAVATVAATVGSRAIAGDVCIDIGSTSAASTGCCYRRRQWWTATWWQVRPTWKVCWWRG